MVFRKRLKCESITLFAVKFNLIFHIDKKKEIQTNDNKQKELYFFRRNSSYASVIH